MLQTPFSNVRKSIVAGYFIELKYFQNETALLLEKELGSMQAFFSTHYREDTDLNREESRDTEYRAGLSAVLKKCREARINCILVDVHSFPPDSYNKERKLIPEVYLIKAYYDAHLGEYLHSYLKNKNIKIGIFDGSYRNDILLEASFYHVPSVIIEFNEALNRKRLKNIVYYLAQGIRSYEEGVERPIVKSLIKKIGSIFLSLSDVIGWMLLLIIGITAFLLYKNRFKKVR